MRKIVIAIILLLCVTVVAQTPVSTRPSVSPDSAKLQSEIDSLRADLDKITREVHILEIARMADAVGRPAADAEHDAKVKAISSLTEGDSKEKVEDAFRGDNFILSSESTLRNQLLQTWTKANTQKRLTFTVIYVNSKMRSMEYDMVTIGK